MVVLSIRFRCFLTAIAALVAMGLVGLRVALWADAQRSYVVELYQSVPSSNNGEVRNVVQVAAYRIYLDRDCLVLATSEFRWYRLRSLTVEVSTTSYPADRLSRLGFWAIWNPTREYSESPPGRFGYKRWDSFGSSQVAYFWSGHITILVTLLLLSTAVLCLWWFRTKTGDENGGMKTGQDGNGDRNVVGYYRHEASPASIVSSSSS